MLAGRYPGIFEDAKARGGGEEIVCGRPEVA